MIAKTDALKLAPAEVEEVLMAHPGVEQAFVVGVPDAERDEVVAAVVVPRDGKGVDANTLTEYCRSELAAYKRPRRYLLVAPTELPLTSTGTRSLQVVLMP